MATPLFQSPINQSDYTESKPTSCRLNSNNQQKPKNIYSLNINADTSNKYRLMSALMEHFVASYLNAFNKPNSLLLNL